MPLHQWKEQVAELGFTLQSQQFFLAHLDARFAHLLPQLERVLPLVQKLQAQQQRLEQELDDSLQEVDFLQREIQTLERVLARQENAQQQTIQQRQFELKRQYQGLQDSLQQVQGKLENWQQRYHSLNEQSSQNIQHLQRELRQSRQLAQAQLQGFENSEQEYLLLLDHKDQQLKQLQALYESEIEQMALEMNQSSQGFENWQAQSQKLGKSLAQLAQERNLVVQNQQDLEQELRSLKAENQSLLNELANYQKQALKQQELQDYVDNSSQASNLQVQALVNGLDVLLGLGLVPDAPSRSALAESFQLPESVIEQVLARCQLQGGRWQQALKASTLKQSLSARQVNSDSVQEDASAAALHAWCAVSADSYPLGDNMHQAERPAHAWQSPGFAIQRLLVSNADFQEFMDAEGYQQPDFWLPAAWRWLQAQAIQAPAFWGKRGYQSGLDFPDYPVIGVSWFEALAYTAWAGLHLPSEAEWEAAARGPEGLTWPWGNEWQSGCANTADRDAINTSPVGIFPEGASPVGCLDLIGNVFEWTRSCYQPYPYQSEDGREELEPLEARSLRGCSWNHKGAYFTRASYRFQADPFTRHSDIGFRCSKA